MTAHTQEASMAVRAEELAEQIDALLVFDAKGALVPHGVGGLARELLTKAATRLRETGAGRVQVKPLEWEKYNPEEFRAFTPFGTYWCGRSGWSYTDGDWQPGDFATAQADYEQRILSTITQPQADEVTEAWRPIETAPKDGTDIILGAPAQEYQGKPTDPRSTVGHWTTDEECRVDVGDCGGECRCREYEYTDPLWLSWDGGFTAENPPTHWMPLPKPPLLAALKAKSQPEGGE